MSLTRLKSWEDLEKHRETLAGTHLRELFAGDPQRVSALSMDFDGLHYDFSKQRLDEKALGLLIDLDESTPPPPVPVLPLGSP